MRELMHISFAMVCVGCVMTSVRCKLIPHQCEDTQLFEQGRFGMWVATAIMMCFHGPFISRTATRGLQDSKRFKIRYAVHIFLAWPMRSSLAPYQSMRTASMAY